MIKIKSISLKIVIFIFFAWTNFNICMGNRVARPAVSMIKQVMTPVVRNSSTYYCLGGRFAIKDSLVLMVPRESSSHADILTLYREYEKELNLSNQDSISNNTKRFIAFRAIEEKYKMIYDQNHDRLYPAILKYHQEKYPVFKVDISVDQSVNENDLFETYEEAFKDYAWYPEFPAGMDSYYHIAKAINAVNVAREKVALQIDLKNYIQDYIHRDTSKEEYNSLNFRRYNLNSVKFGDRRDDGRPMSTAFYNPNNGALQFSSNFLHTISKSEQALVVMHEVEHARQDPWSYSKCHWFLAETHADAQAVKECNCSICLKIRSVSLQGTQFPQGYLNSEDFNHLAAQSIHRCKAHTENDTQELENALNRGDKKVVRELDNSMGTIFDRLPRVKK